MSRLTGLLTRLYRRLGIADRTVIADEVMRDWERLTYHRMIQLGFRPDAIIDVGAYHGHWSLAARHLLGPVPTMMVEAQPGLGDGLRKLCATQPDLFLVNAPLAATAGEEVTFYEMGTGSSLLPENSDAERSAVTLVTDTLDRAAAAHLPGARSIFLKIDVQGAELMVLGGGLKTLARCAAVQLECAILPYNDGAPMMPDVIAFMAGHGFDPIEVSGFSRVTGRLVQIDLLFVPRSSPLRPTRFTVR